MHIKGLLNIQYVVVDGQVYVIKVNPRSSLTVPFLSKVTNIKMLNIATRVALGHTLKEMGYHTGLVEPKPYTAVKAPVFSFAKMQDVDILFTVADKDKDEMKQLAKALQSVGIEADVVGKVHQRIVILSNVLRAAKFICL